MNEVEVLKALAVDVEQAGIDADLRQRVDGLADLDLKPAATLEQHRVGEDGDAHGRPSIVPTPSQNGRRTAYLVD